MRDHILTILEVQISTEPKSNTPKPEIPFILRAIRMRQISVATIYLNRESNVNVLPLNKQTKVFPNPISVGFPKFKSVCLWDSQDHEIVNFNFCQLFFGKNNLEKICCYLLGIGISDILSKLASLLACSCRFPVWMAWMPTTDDDGAESIFAKDMWKPERCVGYTKIKLKCML